MVICGRKRPREFHNFIFGKSRCCDAGDRSGSKFPVIQRVTLPGSLRGVVQVQINYQLPFGVGRAFLDRSGWENETLGCWSARLTFAAQTGTPFTVSPSISTANGGSARAILVGEPYAAGGTPDLTNNPALTSCPTRVRTRENWYNPCAFRDPLPGNLITGSNTVTSEQSALAFLEVRSNVIYGPGYNTVNMSRSRPS
jgi:hypothetical protein